VIPSAVILTSVWRTADSGWRISGATGALHYDQAVSDTTTNGIRVQVSSRYLPERSTPLEKQFWFSYHIRVSNVGEETAQLISRRWIITNADGEQQEVSGPGVVGEQPMLAPGTAFDYTSYCNLTTNVGTMHGSYTMVTPGGETFEAAIAPFTLAMPNALN
jgi:ApaG protein